eukprot:823000-Pelagomonas_calceolata.AAC.5
MSGAPQVCGLLKQSFKNSCIHWWDLAAFSLPVCEEQLPAKYGNGKSQSARPLSPMHDRPSNVTPRSHVASPHQYHQHNSGLHRSVSVR